MPVIHKHKTNNSYYLITKQLDKNAFCTFQVTISGMSILQKHGFLKENAKISIATLFLLHKLGLIRTDNGGITAAPPDNSTVVQESSMSAAELLLFKDLKGMLKMNSGTENKAAIPAPKNVTDELIIIRTKSNKKQKLTKRFRIKMIKCPFCKNNIGADLIVYHLEVFHGRKLPTNLLERFYTYQVYKRKKISARCSICKQTVQISDLLPHILKHYFENPNVFAGNK